MATGIGNKLTGQTGEHLVSAVLGTLGYYASPYSGNVSGFDVTAVNSASLRSFPIQVKTSTKGSLIQSTIDRWCEHDIDKNNYQKLGMLKKIFVPLTNAIHLDHQRYIFRLTAMKLQKYLIWTLK